MAQERNACTILLSKLEADVEEGTLAGACLDTLLALLTHSPLNQQAFLAQQGLARVMLLLSHVPLRQIKVKLLQDALRLARWSSVRACMCLCMSSKPGSTSQQGMGMQPCIITWPKSEDMSHLKVQACLAHSPQCAPGVPGSAAAAQPKLPDPVLQGPESSGHPHPPNKLQHSSRGAGAAHGRGQCQAASQPSGI